MSPDRLPDLLQSGLRLVVCGSAAGARSAALGAYYAGPGNKFWRILHETGLTPRQFEPAEFSKLVAHGIGLTDLAKRYAGGDAGLRRGDDDIAGFIAKIERHRPRFLAFNGKRAAQAVLGRTIDYGRQGEEIGAAHLFVLPSTAGSASGYWDPAPWEALSKAVAKFG